MEQESQAIVKSGSQESDLGEIAQAVDSKNRCPMNFIERVLFPCSGFTFHTNHAYIHGFSCSISNMLLPSVYTYSRTGGCKVCMGKINIIPYPSNVDK